MSADAIIYLCQLGYLAIGLVIMVCAIIGAPAEKRPGLGESIQLCAICALIWPLVLWRMLRDEDGQ